MGHVKLLTMMKVFVSSIHMVGDLHVVGTDARVPTTDWSNSLPNMYLFIFGVSVEMVEEL